jgi:hypothetical protein
MNIPTKFGTPVKTSIKQIKVIKLFNKHIVIQSIMIWLLLIVNIIKHSFEVHKIGKYVWQNFSPKNLIILSTH